MRRKDFLKVGSIVAATASQYTHATGRSQEKAAANVDFVHDGLLLSPKEYANLLMQLADEGKIKPDYYSNGGVVEEMEAFFAHLLGKESAVFMPTGTLANHIAVRHLARGKSRVVAQEQSHLYNDTGDCVQTLSHLNLIPLGMNSVEFTLDEVESIVKKTQLGRVEAGVGAISIESPVRRQRDQMVSYDNIKKITDYAKSRDIKTHLDGARLFVQPIHNQTTVIDYAAPFDTVYTSLWKCFNAASGAVLAGSQAFTTNLFHERRMFGGGLPTAWAFAAVALHFAGSFAEDYKKAWANAETLFTLLQKSEQLKVTKFKNGSHIVALEVKNTNMKLFKEASSKRGIELSTAVGSEFLLKINPSLNRDTPQNIAQYFKESLNESRN